MAGKAITATWRWPAENVKARLNGFLPRGMATKKSKNAPNALSRGRVWITLVRNRVADSTMVKEFCCHKCGAGCFSLYNLRRAAFLARAVF